MFGLFSSPELCISLFRLGRSLSLAFLLFSRYLPRASAVSEFRLAPGGAERRRFAEFYCFFWDVSGYFLIDVPGEFCLRSTGFAGRSLIGGKRRY